MKNMKITPCQYAAYTSYAHRGRCAPLRRRSRYGTFLYSLEAKSTKLTVNRFKGVEYLKKIAMSSSYRTSFRRQNRLISSPCLRLMTGSTSLTLSLYYKYKADYNSGSADVSEHVRQNLPNLLVKRPEFEKGDYEAAIVKAFEDEDALLLRSVMEENPGPVIAGSTVALCLVNLTKGVMVSGNVGDSHIFLARRDEGSEFITWQVRPNNPGPMELY